MEREMKLLYECTLDDLVDELTDRFGDGMIVAIVRKNSRFSIRTHGYLGALDALSGRVRHHIEQLLEEG
jgi:hypothetical protein